MRKCKKAKMTVQTARSFTAVLLILTSCSISGYSQDSSRIGVNKFFWGSVGVGGVNDPQYGGSLFFAKNKHLVSVRYINGEEIEGRDIGKLGKDLPLEKSGQLAIMYGRFINKEHFLATGSIGIGLTEGIKRGKFLYSESTSLVNTTNHHEKISYSTIGVPLDLQVLWKIGKFLGIGLSANADINPKRTTYGILLVNLHMGKLPIN